ncbi:hypothetical protein [Micromonospora sp. NPDC049497]|uniref:hypothetical protein n=1 Tax=Micromonospora sp. NPDC049497 TaxID=3364273 RepID=UPI0037926116
MSSVATPDLVPLSRTRRKLAAFATLTVVAFAAGLPGWTVAALALTSLAIPLAVALAGGEALLRELLRPRVGDSGATPEPGTAGAPRWAGTAGGTTAGGGGRS